MKHWGRGLDTWKPQTPGAQNALTIAREFIGTFQTRSRWTPEGHPIIGQGLLIVGPPGTGKTTLASAILTDLSAESEIRFTAYADYVQGLIDQIQLGKLIERSSMLRDRDLLSATRQWSVNDQALKAIANRKLVCFDDVGKERVTGTGFAQFEFDRIIRMRARSGRPNLVTSNVKPDEWGTLYNPSMGSFIKEAFVEIILGGKDLRL